MELQISDSPNEEALKLLEETSPDSSGTVVFWENADRIIRDFSDPTGKPAKAALKRQQNRLYEHLAMTFQRFLDKSDNRAQNINITINGDKIEPWDPFQREYSKLVSKEVLEVGETSSKVLVQGFVLPRREEFEDKEAVKNAKLSSDNQGVYIYRNNRLLHPSTWLGMFRKEPHLTLLRVEFSFDHLLDEYFYLDLKKSQVILNDRIWNWFKDEFIPPLRRVAEKRYRSGQNKLAKNRSETLHDPSNKSIGSKEDEIQTPDISDADFENQEVTLTNEQGTFKNFRLKLVHANKPDEVYIKTVDSLEDGILFEPALIEGHKAVLINTSHEYYHKVYLPNIKNSVTVQGMDSLLWALCVGELKSTTDQITKTFKKMRFEVSHILRTLVEDLPDPKLEESEEDEDE